MSFASRVPDGYDYWYYDEELDALMFNDGEYGWVKWNHEGHSPEQVRDELDEALNGLR